MKTIETGDIVKCLHPTNTYTVLEVVHWHGETLVHLQLNGTNNKYVCFGHVVQEVLEQ